MLGSFSNAQARADAAKTDPAAPLQRISLQRSRSKKNESNRTIDPAGYKALSRRIDVSELDAVVEVDVDSMLMHVEPSVPMDELASQALAYGVVPQVVLEFPGITVGGALSGGALESSSARYGHFFDTIDHVDVLTGDGTLERNVSRTHKTELFYALNASYGTCGLLTRVAVRLTRASPFVRVRYLHFTSMEAMTEGMTALADTPERDGSEPPEFIDGVALGPRSFVAVVGDPCAVAPAACGVRACRTTGAPLADGAIDGSKTAPFVSLRGSRTDPWFYWHLVELCSPDEPSLSPLPRARTDAAAIVRACGSKGAADTRNSHVPIADHIEYMRFDDFLFRFDRGAFWMARPGLQLFYGVNSFAPPSAHAPRSVTASVGSSDDVQHVQAPGHAQRQRTVGTLFRLKYAWLCTTRQLYRMLHKIGDELLARHFVVQDFVMPSADAACKLAAFATCTTGIYPLWVCPVRTQADSASAPSNAGFGFPIRGPQAAKPGTLMFNVGVYGAPHGGTAFDPVELNRTLEARVTALGGRKMLYAQSFYTREEFWKLFDRDAYEQARTAAHASDLFADVADKLLMRPARLEQLRGVKAVSFAHCFWSMAEWYVGGATHRAAGRVATFVWL